MTENSQDELTKRANNLFNALQKNPKSIFYLTGNATRKTLLNKAAKSAFEKDKLFVNLYNQKIKKKLKNPIKIEKRSLDLNDSEYFQEIYDFMSLRKIGTNQLRNEKYNEKIDEN